MKYISRPNEKEQEIEIDFKIVKEDWSRYNLEDGTILRLKISVFKVLRSPELSNLGYPDFGISARNIISGLVPTELKGKYPKGKFEAPKDLDKEIQFTVDNETTQIYETVDGWRLFVQPKLAKVFRFKVSNEFNEPVYSVNLQQLFNVEKINK